MVYCLGAVSLLETQLQKIPQKLTTTFPRISGYEKTMTNDSGARSRSIWRTWLSTIICLKQRENN